MPEERYDASEWEGRQPNIQRIDNVLYCDGIPIHLWQLTEPELFKYFPEVYVSQGKQSICPICGRKQADSGKTGIVHHLSNTETHKEAYLKCRPTIDAAKNWYEIYTTIMEHLKCQKAITELGPATQSN